MQAELVVRSRWIVPVHPSTLLEDHALAIGDGRILALLPGTEAERSIECSHWVDLSNHLLIPGLVNAHTHAAMTLMRGYADDLPLDRWLQKRIWPTEAHHLSEEFVRDGTLAAAAEMLAGGITTFGDMYFFPAAAIEAATQLGIRIVAGLVVIGFPSAYAPTPGEYLERGLETRDAWSGHPLVSFMLAPHAPYSVDTATLARIAAYAGETGLAVQTHLHETPAEVQADLDEYHRRPLARLDQLGLVTPGLCAVHMTQVNDEDLALLARHAVNVVHCPESNLKLASGFCPVAHLQAAGINIALGTDGAASNNDLDMIGEMRTAALLAKGVAGDPAAFDARKALTAATLGGARALGLETEIGSLEVGKWADLTALDFSANALHPLYDPLSQLVYSAGRGAVSEVWVAGRQRLSRGRILDHDSAALARRLDAWETRLKEDKEEIGHLKCKTATGCPP